jgi:nitrite reductase/ring-hydroxylating ferredoxin subunit
MPVGQFAEKFVVCPSEELADGQYLKFALGFEQRNEECVLFRFAGKVYAYLNRCVHMPRRLDCEEKQIFDRSGRYLRCSMHGIVYIPETGTSISTMCEGEQLRAVTVYEADGVVGFADFRITAAPRLIGKVA